MRDRILLRIGIANEFESEASLPAGRLEGSSTVVLSDMRTLPDLLGRPSRAHWRGPAWR